MVGSVVMVASVRTRMLGEWFGLASLRAVETARRDVLIHVERRRSMK